MTDKKEIQRKHHEALRDFGSFGFMLLGKPQIL